MIRWIFNEGPLSEFQGIAALEIDGVFYTREEVEAIVMAHQSGEARNTSVRGLHRITGTFCAVPGCGEKRIGVSAYCKMHDMRYQRHGDPEVALRPWDKRKAERQ